MKKILAFLILLPAIACSQSGSQKTGWAKFQVNGKVEEMLSKTYTAIIRNGKAEPDQTKQIYYEDNVFDSVGYITESYVQKLHWLFISVYKKNSNEILYTTNPHINKAGAMDTVIHIKGVPDSIITKDNDGNIYNTTKIKVDKAGNIIERVKRNANGNIIEITRSVYKDGMIISESVTDGANKLLRKIESQIGSNGRINLTRVFNDKEELLYATFEYSDFDEFGNWTTKLEYDKSGKVVRMTKRGFMYYGKKEKGAWQ